MSEHLTAAASASLTKSKVEAAEQTGFIEIILALIPVLLPLILECFASPERAAKVANNPGWIQRFRLRREIRKQLPGDDADTEKAREVLFDAVLAAGKAATAADFASLGTPAS